MLCKKIFSERLKMLRTQNKVTMLELATAVGLKSKSTISELENNNSSPSIDTLVAMADYFGVSLDYLTGRTDNPIIYKSKSRGLQVSEDSNIQEEYNPIRDILRNLPKNMDK